MRERARERKVEAILCLFQFVEESFVCFILIRNFDWFYSLNRAFQIYAINKEVLKVF